MILDRDDIPDLMWVVVESDVYKDKDLLSLVCPPIPTDAAGERPFWNAFKLQVSNPSRFTTDPSNHRFVECWRAWRQRQEPVSTTETKTSGYFVARYFCSNSWLLLTVFDFTPDRLFGDSTQSSFWHRMQAYDVRVYTRI